MTSVSPAKVQTTPDDRVSRSFFGRQLLAFVALSTLSLAHAQAQSVLPVTVGVPFRGAIISGTKFSSSLELGRSYTCTVSSNDPASELALSATIEQPYGNQGIVKLIGDLSPAVAVPSSDASNTDNRVSIIPTSLQMCNPSLGCQDLGRSGLHEITVTTKSGGENVEFMCEDSTLFVGFNTSVSDYNWLELERQSAGGLSILSTIESSTGATLGTRSTDLISGGHRRFDVGVHDIVGSGVYGRIVLRHNGPVGALRARLAQYTVQNGKVVPTVSELASGR